MTIKNISDGTRMINAVLADYKINPYTVTIDLFNVYIQAYYSHEVMAALQESNKFQFHIDRNGYTLAYRRGLKITLTS